MVRLIINKNSDLKLIRLKIECVIKKLRNTVDGWDMCRLIMGILFYRFISDKGKGFDIKPHNLFSNFKERVKSCDDVSNTLKEIVTDIIESSQDKRIRASSSDIFLPLCFSHEKIGPTQDIRNKNLIVMIEAISDLPLQTTDLFGNAYEYLLRIFSSSIGKSSGEFYTPERICTLLTKIAVNGKTQVHKVYDPTCGSARLLFEPTRLLGIDNILKGLFGQEINPSAKTMSLINQFIYDIPTDKFSIQLGDTLLSPAFGSEAPFDVIVANPPFALRWEGSDKVDLLKDERFEPARVLAPKQRADFAFIMHILHYLSDDGTAAIAQCPAILSRGHTEKEFRRYLIENNFIDAIIHLPHDQFLNTDIAICILVLKKNKSNSDILFIKASSGKRGNKIPVTELWEEKVLEVLSARKEILYFSKIVSNKIIAENNYALPVDYYIDIKVERKEINITNVNLEIDRARAKRLEAQNQFNSFNGAIS